MQNIIAPKADRSSRPNNAMAKTASSPSQDKTADVLQAIGVGFLINLILGAALPQVGPFIAGLAAGAIAKTGPLRGAVAGSLAGTLGELASLALWVLTNLISFPSAFLPYAFETSTAIITAISAVMALSGGIVGGVASSQHWLRIHEFLIHHHISLPFLHHAGQTKIQQEES